MKKLNFFKKKAEEDELKGKITWETKPFLKLIKPKEGYLFYSDYYIVDGVYCSILDFYHKSGADDNFFPFWGIDKLPGRLPDDVTVINFEQIKRMGEGWVDDRLVQSETINNLNQQAQDQAGSVKSKHNVTKSQKDLDIISKEIINGASYLNVHSRFILKAPSLQSLDDALVQIEIYYNEVLSTLISAAHHGVQKKELSDLFSYNRKKKGKGLYFTSTEYAGSYSLVTNGLEDAGGEFVGRMIGDVNTSAIIFDVDYFRKNVVVASSQMSRVKGRDKIVRVSDMWGSKISQSALINNRKAHHIILSDTNMSDLGPEFKSITSLVDLNKGDINMFEMFGNHEDELSIFPSQMQKLILMAEQAYETNDRDRAIIRGSLEDIATQFYIDSRMWVSNAGLNRDKLRIVGINHEEVPKLHKFTAYLDQRYKEAAVSHAKDPEMMHALNILRTSFRNLLSNNGDLFNTTTKKSIDKATKKQRVLYDLSKLVRRGKNIQMAQLVNIFSFAINNLGYGDTLIIHGVDLIAPEIKEYLEREIDRLYDKGGRCVFLYNNVTKALADTQFSSFARADYHILGTVTAEELKTFEKVFDSNIPSTLSSQLKSKSSNIAYIKRDHVNVIFASSLELFPRKVSKPKTVKERLKQKEENAFERLKNVFGLGISSTNEDKKLKEEKENNKKLSKREKWNKRKKKRQ